MNLSTESDNKAAEDSPQLKVTKTMCENVIDDFMIQNRTLYGVVPEIEVTDIKYTGRYILDKFKTSPDFIGQIDAKTGRTTTFREMREKSIKCALFMRRMGVNKGDTIIICIYNHIDAYIPYLACLYIGAIANFWHVDYFNSPARYNNFLMQTKPKIIFTLSQFVATLELTIAHLQKLFSFFPYIISINKYTKNESLCLDTIMSEISDLEIEKFSCANVNKLEPAIAMFSPSTTSYLDNNVEVPYMMFWHAPNRRVPTMKENDVGLWYTPLCSLHGPFLTVFAIFEQVTVIKSNDFSEKDMNEIIQKYKVNWVFLDSKTYTNMTRDICVRNYDLSSLRELVCDGEIKTKIYFYLQITMPLNVSVIKVYSMLQTGVIAYENNGKSSRCQGYVAQMMQVIIVNRIDRTIEGQRTLGEIWCKCPYPILNRNGLELYPRNPEFRQTVTAIDKERINKGWFYTGDWGYYDEKGGIFVMDKISNILFFRNGNHICRGKIENGIALLLDIRGACILYVPDSKLEYKLLLFLWTNKAVQENLLFKHLNKHPYISGHIHKDDIYVLNNIPHLPNGRVDRMRLQSIYSSVSKKAFK